MTHPDLDTREADYIAAREQAGAVLAELAKVPDLNAKHELLAQLLLQHRTEHYLKGYRAARIIIAGDQP
jgi:hypothetical protein